VRGDGKGDPLRVGGGYSPAWSPDGKRLTFVSYERGSGGKPCLLHLVTADGTELATRAGGQAEWLSTGELLINSSDEGWLLLDRDGRDSRITVTLNQNIGVGRFSGILEVETDHAEQPRIEVQFSGRVAEKSS